jgi:hypothetical protein
VKRAAILAAAGALTFAGAAQATNYNNLRTLAQASASYIEHHFSNVHGFRDATCSVDTEAPKGQREPECSADFKRLVANGDLPTYTWQPAAWNIIVYDHGHKFRLDGSVHIT